MKKETKKVTKFKMPKKKPVKIKIEERTVPFVKHLLDLSITYNDGFTKGYDHGRKSILEMQNKVKTLNRQVLIRKILFWVAYSLLLLATAFVTWEIMTIITTK